MTSIPGSHVAALYADAPAGGPAFQRLADSIRLATMDGRLPLGHRLPSERALAAALGLSRTTVAAAYDELRQTGFARSRHGSGTHTATPAGERVHRSAPTAWAPHPRSELMEWSHAAPSAPVPHLVQAYERGLAQLCRFVTGHGYEPYGLPELREAVAQRYRDRGLPTAAEQILITPGAQSAHVIVLATLSAPGRMALVEQPSYPHALDAIARHRLLAVPLDVERGWQVEQWRAVARTERPAFAYLVPDHHNPTGQRMSDAVRGRLADALAGVTVVVDETLESIAFDGAAATPFAAFGPAISVGGMSKIAWGGMRVGWIRADPELITRFAGYRSAMEGGVPVLEQLTAVELLADLSYLSERVAGLRESRDVLMRAVAQTVPQWRFEVPAGGLSLWVDLGEPIASRLALDLLRRQVRVTPGTRFAVPASGQTMERRLRLPFTLPAPELLRGVALLGEVAGVPPTPATTLDPSFA